MVILVAVLPCLEVFGDQKGITLTAGERIWSAAGDVAGRSVVDGPLGKSDIAQLGDQHQDVERDHLRAGRRHVAVSLLALGCCRSNSGHCCNTDCCSETTLLNLIFKIF